MPLPAAAPPTEAPACPPPPKGVNPGRLLEGFGWPEFRWRRGELRSQFEGRTLLVGVDDMDVFKGIELKLQVRWGVDLGLPCIVRGSNCQGWTTWEIGCF